MKLVAKPIRLESGTVCIGETEVRMTTSMGATQLRHGCVFKQPLLDLETVIVNDDSGRSDEFIVARGKDRRTGKNTIIIVDSYGHSCLFPVRHSYRISAVHGDSILLESPLREPILLRCLDGQWDNRH